MVLPTMRKSTDLLAHRRGGGITKRRHAPTDRDGDLIMDGSRANRSRGRGRATNTRETRPQTSTPAGRGSLNTNAFHQQVLRATGGSARTARPKPGTFSRHLRELKVTGWSGSKASTNADGGVASLIQFLEKRATIHKNKQAGSNPTPATVKKSKVDGQALVISVPSDEMTHFLKVDGYMFAGTNIKIEQSRGRSRTPPRSDSTAEPPPQWKELFTNFLSRRYNPETKLLDLSVLGQDQELTAAGVFAASTQSKFFPALMRFCDTFFTSAEQKRETVQSVTLAGNELSNLQAVTTLSQTFPDIQNLDLSKNQFASLSSLGAWRSRFRSLAMLYISPNPIEEKEPGFREQLKSWYPTLRFLDGVEVRSAEEAEKSRLRRNGLPVRQPIFQDENGIVATFVQNFYAKYDGDRESLMDMYYTQDSKFSMSLNNRALHDSNQQQTQPHEWDGYIKQSRNLKHITHLPARVNRQFKGTDAIRKIFSTLPATQHPSFAEFPQKWCIESHSVPGLPDPSGQSPTGVQGFSIIIHGEFEEVGSKKRSFDRTFIIGPGPTKPSGVAVVSDCLVVRGYGGYTAWEPEVQNSAPSMDGQAQMSDQEKVFAVMQVTGLTAQYAEMALMENGGDIQGAVAAFEAAKSQGVLPPDAFAQ